MNEAGLPSTDSRTAEFGRKASRRALAVGPADLPLLERLSQPNAGAFLTALAAHLGLWLLGLLGVAWLAKGEIANAWVLQAVMGLVMGSQLHALTVLQHDCGHQSAFRSRTMNRWVGRALAWFIVLPFTSFTELHRMHHSHLGVAGKDPDNWFYANGPRWMLLRESLFVPRFIGLSLAAALPAATRRRVSVELAFNLTGHAAVLGALWSAGRMDVWAFGFALPMCALAAVFNPLARGAEHSPMAHIPARDVRREDIRFNTVTVAHRGWGLAWANITYHVEHHLYPRVPFHRLPQVHALLRSRRYLRTHALLPFMRPPQ